MATLGRYESFAQDDAGNVLTSPTIEVRRESDNGLAAIYSDRAGGSPLGNPYTGGSDGLIAFHALGNAYKIVVTKGAISRTLRYVPVGTSAETDISANNSSNSWVNVKDAPFFAQGDSSTDDTAAIAAAMAATPSGGTLFFPVGSYRVIGSGSTIFSRTDPIWIRGAGWGSCIFVDSSVPTSRDIITFAPTISTQGWGVRDLSINNFGATAGRYGIHLNQAGGTLFYSIRLENMLILTSDHSIKGTGLEHVGGVLAYSNIRNVICESFEFINAGDGLVIESCTVGGTHSRNTIFVSGVPGAGNFILSKSIVTGKAGFVIVDGYTSPYLEGNEMEANATNSYGFLVDIKSSSKATLAPRLLNNHYTVQAGVGNPIPIRIRTNTFKASIEEGRISVPTGVHIQIDSGATDTVWSTDGEFFVNNIEVPPAVSDAGTRTVVKTQGEIISLAANQTGSNSSTAQTWFPGGGATQFTVADDSTYEFEGLLAMARTAGTTSHSTSLLFAGTATVGSIVYTYDGLQSTGGFFGGGNSQIVLSQQATALTLFGATSSANEHLVHRVKGRVRFTAPGTFIPQFKYDNAPGGAPTVQANSFFRMRRIGTDAFLSNGYVS